jgi:hypothetical protein
MTKRATKVIRDFSELKPIESRIEAVAHSFLQVAFKGEVHPDFEPKQGSQAHRVWRMGKMAIRHQIAWQNLMNDVKLSAGRSGSVCANYGEGVDRGDGSDFRVPKARTNPAYRRLERLRELMGRRERQLLHAMVQDSLVSTSGLQLEVIGLVQSGYGDKVSARAAGVATIQSLLDRLADLYQV